jgi:SP family myo-inositol transporter-like MFS transporter 13
MLEWFSPSWTFVIYAVLCVVGWILVWLFYPETSGMSLEETGMLLSDGWGAGINAPLLRERRVAARIAAANANNQS